MAGIGMYGTADETRDVAVRVARDFMGEGDWDDLSSKLETICQCVLDLDADGWRLIRTRVGEGDL